MLGSHVVFVDGVLHVWSKDQRGKVIKQAIVNQEGPVARALLHRLVTEQQRHDRAVEYADRASIQRLKEERGEFDGL